MPFSLPAPIPQSPQDLLGRGPGHFSATLPYHSQLRCPPHSPAILRRFSTSPLPLLGCCSDHSAGDQDMATNGATTSTWLKPGAKVEVKTHDPGFTRDWLHATVVGLFDKDNPTLVVEKVVSASLVRPARPSSAEHEELRPGDTVEAFVKNAWQIGKVSDIVGTSFIIDLVGSNSLSVNASNVRKHLDWLNGEWVAPSTCQEEVPHCHVTKRKRGRPRGRCGKSKRKLPPILEGRRTRRGNSQLNRVHSMHEFESNASHSEHQTNGGMDGVANNFVASALVDAEADAEVLSEVFDTSLPANHNLVSNETNIMNSNGNQELAIVQVSNEACLLNLPSNESGHTNAIANTEVPMPEPPLHYSFVEMTSVLDFITSLDIFRVLPQRPHFIPLEQVEEDSREGIAFGYMINFARLVDSIHTLDVGDSINVLMKKLKALDDFEQYGFDVQILKLQLEDLIQVKRNHEDLMCKQAQVGTEVERKDAEFGIINADFDAVEQSLSKQEDEIAVMRSRRTAILEDREQCQSMMSKLKMEFQGLQKKSDGLKGDFSRIAMKPW